MVADPTIQACERGKVRVNYAIVFVSDMERSVSFYRDVLEFALKFETSHWTEFAADGVTLALHLGDASESDSAAPEHTTAGRCRPGFSVPNLDEFHQKMADHDVICVQEPKETFGSRVAQYLDPDGLAFSVGENPKSG